MRTIAEKFLEQKKAAEQYYNTKNFPYFVRHHGNFDIYRDQENYCAVIAINPQYISSFFGTLEYVKNTIGIGENHAYQI